MEAQIEAAEAAAAEKVAVMRAAVRSCTPPGSAPDVHSGVPSGEATTCTFTPWVRWFEEKYGRSARTRSVRTSVPSSTRWRGPALFAASSARPSFGERADSSTTVSST
ncbi:hypothetical protein Ssi02_58010 [Sinosporangium siamense]|uniref:Uncharacterized protein n=1 Tax=Sinosporangium siamense TaxID=1367973 RepID=A0A919RMH7_9ACTN|nr:hypothetical protein Ssi02_58010 [Sinosporangium siamense]